MVNENAQPIDDHAWAIEREWATLMRVLDALYPRQAKHSGLVWFTNSDGTEKADTDNGQ